MCGREEHTRPHTMLLLFPYYRPSHQAAAATVEEEAAACLWDFFAVNRYFYPPTPNTLSTSRAPPVSRTVNNQKGQGEAVDRCLDKSNPPAKRAHKTLKAARTLDGLDTEWSFDSPCSLSRLWRRWHGGKVNTRPNKRLLELERILHSTKD